jgi:uncharacterized protein (TIGR02147 family)
VADLQRRAALGEEHVWLLEKWFYVPMLNLATMPGFQDKREWIAARLQISLAEAAAGLARLVEAGFLTRGPEGVSRGELEVRFPTSRSHERLRLFQRRMIQRADSQLTNAPTEEEFAARLLSSLCFAGDPSRLPEAKLVIEEALYKAAEILAGGDCTEVFQLNLQLFRLTK